MVMDLKQPQIRGGSSKRAKSLTETRATGGVSAKRKRRHCNKMAEEKLATENRRAQTIIGLTSVFDISWICVETRTQF